MQPSYSTLPRPNRTCITYYPASSLSDIFLAVGIFRRCVQNKTPGRGKLLHTTRPSTGGVRDGTMRLIICPPSTQSRALRCQTVRYHSGNYSNNRRASARVEEGAGDEGLGQPSAAMYTKRAANSSQQVIYEASLGGARAALDLHPTRDRRPIQAGQYCQ